MMTLTDQECSSEFVPVLRQRSGKVFFVLATEMLEGIGSMNVELDTPTRRRGYENLQILNLTVNKTPVWFPQPSLITYSCLRSIFVLFYTLDGTPKRRIPNASRNTR
jgi:hypothetical protein